MSFAMRLRRVVLLALIGGFAAAALDVRPGYALTIELKDVAPDRIERQRAASSGNLPLPGTPDLASFEQRLASKGLKAGSAVFIRIFKAESELEVWIRSGSQFVLLDTYPICHWSGTLGPKQSEGDKQTPEGFYEVSRKQLHLIGRHPRSLNLGFPNAVDKSLHRTGSYILVHGGCSSVGCIAMTNAVVAEIYELAARALKSGQDRVHVHVFPFRMTEANLDTHKSNEWYSFWSNLKEGYDAFEQTRVPPNVGSCEKRYVVQTAAEDAADAASNRGSRRYDRRERRLGPVELKCPPVAGTVMAALPAGTAGEGSAASTIITGSVAPAFSDGPQPERAFVDVQSASEHQLPKKASAIARKDNAAEPIKARRRTGNKGARQPGAEQPPEVARSAREGGN